MNLSLFADVAGLLGFSMQVLEKLTSKYGSKEGEVLAFLIGLSEKSKAVKKVHTKYHSLYHALSEVNNFLKDPNQTKKYRALSNINRDELLSILSDTNIADACYYLENHLNYEIGDLKITADKRIQEKLAVIKEEDNKIFQHLENIIRHQNDICVLHHKYLSLFEKLKPLIYKTKLSESDTSFILSQRPYFSIHYNTMIYYTDEVLMNYLDLYNRTLEYINN